MIKFHCIKCGKGVKAPDKYAGKTVKCPSCQTGNLLPDGEEVIQHQIEEIEVNHYEGVFCQQCGNKIRKDAFICPKCGCKNNLNKVSEFEEEVKAGTIVAAYFLSLFIPLFGIIAGIYLMCKNKVAHGIACVLISIFIGIPFSIGLLGGLAAV